MDRIDHTINQIQFFLTTHPWILVALIIWMISWKGIALWKAARLMQKKWFIILLVVNTFGILEIIYIYFVNKELETTSKSSM